MTILTKTFTGFETFPKSVPKRSNLTKKRLKFASFPKKAKIPSYILRGSKFGNVPSQYKGRIYHSKFEAEYAIILDDMKKHKEIKSWKPQVTLRLKVNGKLICKYIADFMVDRGGGVKEIHETKGYFTPVAKLKWKLAQALYPNYKFILIK